MKDIDDSDADFVILNGLSLGISQYPKLLLRLATNRHLIVADNFSPAILQIMKAGINPAYILTVSPIQGKQGLIRVDFRAPETLLAI